MADEDLEFRIDVDTGSSSRELASLSDDSRAAGDALDELDAKARAVDPVVELDVDLDTGKARAAGDALEDLDRKGRGMADGVGFGNNALRDLTGPLGDSVGPAGDLGDAFEGLGDIVGGVAAKLGASADTVGKLSGAVAGVGVVVAAGVAAWNLYRAAQRKAEEQARKLYEIQEQLSDGKIEEAVASITEEYGGTIQALKDLGYNAGQLITTFRGQGTVIDDLERQIGTLTEAYDEANVNAAKGVAGERDRALAIREQLDALVKLQGNLEDVQGAWQENELKIGQNRATTAELVAALGGVKDAGDDAADSVSAIEDAFTDLTKALDAADAIENVRDAFDDVEQAALDAWNAAAEEAPDAEGKMRDYEQAVRDALREVGGLGDEIDGIPPETVARIFAEVQQGDLEEARRILDEVEQNVEPIKLTIDLADLDKQAAVAAARAGAAVRAGAGGQGSVGYMRDNYSGGGVTNVYYPPQISPTELTRATTEYGRIQGGG